MTKSEAFCNLRGGPVYAAAGVQPGTARAWIAKNGLRVGRREQTAQPRFSLADVARLTLMRLLTNGEGRASAEDAAKVVNHAETAIATIAEAELAKMDDPDAESVFEQTFLVIPEAGRSPEFRTPQQHEIYVRDRSIVLVTVVDLQALVTLSRDSLRNALQVVGA